MTKSIPLSQGKFAIVDDDDYEKISIYKWSMGGKQYAKARINGKNVYLHRFIMNPPENMVVDHIDRNGFNNQKTNLRICTQSQNLKNSDKKIDNRSGYKGVSWHKKSSKWQVTLRNRKGKVYIGIFDELPKAVEAYKNASVEYYGEFAG